MQEILVKAGYRVLTYDNFGSAWSAAPKTRYDDALFASQLTELLYTLNITQPVHLVGQSMGGGPLFLCIGTALSTVYATAGIVSKFASLHCECVKSLSLIAPVGLPVNIPLLARLHSLPYFSEILYHWLAEPVMVQRVFDAFPGTIVFSLSII